MAKESVPSVRFATQDDLPTIASIYAHYVEHSVCTFAVTPPSDDEWQTWFEVHTSPHAAIVAEVDGRVAGWASLSRWNVRCAYRHTVENSVYVHHDTHRRGLGRILMTRIIEIARREGIRQIIAQIADHQTASERLHGQFGFRRVGCLERVGLKFGREIDVCIFQLSLANDAVMPSGPP